MKKILTLAMPVLVALAFVRPEAKAWDIDAKYTGPKTVTTDISWHPDILPGYEARYVNQGEQFDGPCRSTIVRLKAKKPTKKGLLTEELCLLFCRRAGAERNVQVCR